MIALPTTFELNFVEVWQSSQTHRFFIILSGVPGAVLMSPNAKAVSHHSDTYETPFLLYTFSIWRLPHIVHGPWQSLQFCMDFNHLRMVLIVYYKCLHLLIDFNPGATWLCLLTEILVASSSIFSLQLKKSFSNTFPHLHITMNSASPKQSHPHSHK